MRQTYKTFKALKEAEQTRFDKEIKIPLQIHRAKMKQIELDLQAFQKICKHPKTREISGLPESFWECEVCGDTDFYGDFGK